MARVRIRVVTDNHYILHCDGAGTPLACTDPRVPKSGQRWIRQHIEGSVDRAVVATMNGALVGFFRFDIRRRAIRAYGTWVHPDHRRKGLATRMWNVAKRHSRTSKVYVYTVSVAGDLFVRSVSKNVVQFRKQKRTAA